MFLITSGGQGFSGGLIVTASDLAIINPGAELGNMSGWTVTGAMEAHTGGGGWPAAYEGTYLFAGGYGVTTTAVQAVSIDAASHGIIDAGSAFLDFSWRQRSYGGLDRGDVEIEFLDAGSASLGAAVGLGMVAASSGAWALRTHSALAIPVGARFVSINMRGQKYGGSYNDAYFDALAGNIY